MIYKKNKTELDFFFQLRWSSGDQIYSLPWNNLEKLTKYMKQWSSRHWISDNQGQWSLRSKKQTREALCLPSSNMLEEFPACSTERDNIGKTQQTIWVETEPKVQGDQDSQNSEDRVPEWRELA